MALTRILGIGGRASESPDRNGGGEDAAEALLLMRNFESSAHGWFWSADAEGQLHYISENIASALAGGRSSVLGAKLTDIFESADDDEAGGRPLPFLLAKQRPFDKIVIRASIGSDPRFWALSGSPQYDRSARFTGFRGSAVDVTAQRQSSEQASQLAKYDTLTGLPNRRRMTEVLDANLATSEFHRKSCGVMLIDLDRFKQINDTLGHPAGDALLKQVGDRLTRIVGDREKVFRLGGDEFEIIVEGCEDRGVIGELAANIIAELSQPYSVEGSRCVIGASIGIAIAPADGRSRGDLIRNADLALYASKSGGRGRFRFFSSDLLEAAEDKRALENDLRDALAKGEITLTYQPIVDARTNVVTGVEALMRWQHPSRGAISPAVFIPIAEEAGLIGPLGEWALRTACAEAAGWPGRLRVAVNVSPIQFTGDGLLSTIASALAASGLAPDQLELEITEGVFLGNSSSTDTMFDSLKGLGVRLALDDFGTGYSSLGYLRNAPFDKIKIDQTFVREATLPGSRNGAIIAAIVALAEALGMETTAEGIEYMDQLRLIRSLRVSHVQGWVYSKAIASEEVAQRMESGEWSLEPSGPQKQRSERQAVYRKVGILHGNRYATAIMRNLSDTGALIDGIAQLPAGALVLVDFGDGELNLARVVHSKDRRHGLRFETPLVDDGNGGLCTRQRISRYQLNAAGFPVPGSPDTTFGDADNSVPIETLAASLGLSLAPPPQQPALGQQGWSESCGRQPHTPTFQEVTERFLSEISGEERADGSVERDLRSHVLPKFGQLRLDQVSEPDVLNWLAEKANEGQQEPGIDARLHALMKQLWAVAIQLELPGVGYNPLEGSVRFDRRGQGAAVLSALEARKLIDVARSSQNRQLKFIIALLMLTGARPGEILNARWEDFDLAAGVWWLEIAGPNGTRELRLTRATTDLLAQLPRWDDCAYLVPNPATKRPYLTIARSWEVARSEAGLPYLEIDDLRYCDLGAAAWDGGLLAATLQA
jgi:diguanylate cyclase (GGDEF)-like protein